MEEDVSAGGDSNGEGPVSTDLMLVHRKAGEAVGVVRSDIVGGSAGGPKGMRGLV